MGTIPIFVKAIKFLYKKLNDIFFRCENISLNYRSSGKFFSLEKLFASIYVQIWTVMNILDKHIQYLDAEHRIVARLCAVAIVTVYFG